MSMDSCIVSFTDCILCTVSTMHFGGCLSSC